MTKRAPPRATRSVRSAGPAAVVVGMMTAPSFITPRVQSHSSAWLPIMSMTRSPRPTPWVLSQAATRSDRAAMASKVYEEDSPSSSTMTRASRELPRATASNQSTAQLKRSPTSGQAKRSIASSWRPLRETSRSRASR